jgi:large conductance mechanosensitive channel
MVQGQVRKFRARQLNGSLRIIYMLKTMLKEFKEFINRGSVIDLAVGIVIGAAFTKIVDSFVKDILMPPIGRITGGADFSNLYINLSGQHYASLDEATKAGAATINYGIFLNNIISFLIVAFAVFLLVRGYNRLRRKKDEKPATPARTCPYCKMPIPDAATRCGHCTSEIAAA